MIALWGILLAILAWGGVELMRDPSRLNTDQPVVPALELPQLVVPMMPSVPLSQFSAVVQRPLFFADRRLPELAAAVKIPAMSAPARVVPPRVQLTAILADGTHQRKALLVSRRGKEQVLMPGDMIDGWRLMQVGIDDIVLTANEQQHRIKLYDFPDKATRSPP